MDIFSRLWVYFLFLVGIPGWPFAIAMAYLKTMGDGTGNESSFMEFYGWCLFFGACVWIALIWGVIWFWNHATVTIV